ncbi:MAG TPA: hypothetical protein VF950_03380 [Planctomycetota bacterium]
MDLSVPQIQLVIYCVHQAIRKSEREIDASKEDVTDLEAHLLQLMNLAGDLRQRYDRLREKDKSLLSYENLTGEVRFRKL